MGEYEAEMSKLREMRHKGTLSEKQYEARRQTLLKKWKKEVDDGLRK